ncbi:MAG TPA: hypothetical protein VF576_06790 [Rubricoccaceae bacterium]
MAFFRGVPFVQRPLRSLVGAPLAVGGSFGSDGPLFGLQIPLDDRVSNAFVLRVP